MTDTRCVYCNWLNKEVSYSFICTNCNKDNTATLIINEDEEQLDKNIQYSSKRRSK